MVSSHKTVILREFPFYVLFFIVDRFEITLPDHCDVEELFAKSCTALYCHR